MTMADDRTTTTHGEPETGMRPWKPYESDPVLTPAMAQGPAAVSTAELDRLRIYLEAVAHDRPGPLHTAVAFNAAYFGFETGGEGYGNGAFDLNAFPVLTLDSEIPALPVGALVRIATGSDPLYAELVYKEGRGAVHDALGHTAEGSVTRPELLVPDLNAFGPGLALDEKQVKRLRSRGRWLGQDGHVTVDARYPSGWLFGLDDTAAFAQHLLSTQIDSLLDPLVPHSVVHLAGSRRPERLRAALGHLLATVAYVLNTSDYLRRVGPYTLTRERVAQGLAYDGPLCAADLAALAKTLGAGPIPSGRRRRHGSTVLTTMDTRIGPWLRDVHGAESLLTGVEYAVSVCRANLAMADFVSSEAEDSVLANGVRVELVDAFEDGGIWRSTYLGPRKAESSTPSADHEDLADRPEPSAPWKRRWTTTTDSASRTTCGPSTAKSLGRRHCGSSTSLRALFPWTPWFSKACPGPAPALTRYGSNCTTQEVTPSPRRRSRRRASPPQGTVGCCPASPGPSTSSPAWYCMFNGRVGVGW